MPPFRVAIALALLPAVLATAGCSSGELRGRVEDLPDPGLVFVQPYAGRRDTCRLVSDTPLTRPYLRAGADLVACPSGYAGGFALVAERGARQVGRTPRYTLYSVPRPVPAPAR